MRHKRFSQLLGMAAIAVVLAAPAAASKSADFVRPPYAGAYEPKDKDERGLWMELDEAERKLADSPGIVRDQALGGYVHDVLCKAVGDERCKAVRSYVVIDDSFNASMAPNGMMLVHTGLLARIHSEAELAAVLGHEFGHFELRHSLFQFKKLRNSQNWAVWLSLIGGFFSVNTSSVRNAFLFDVLSFSRNQEFEADRISVEVVLGSPYRLQAASIWQRALEEDDAFRVDHGMKKVRRLSPGLTDTHPTDLQRVVFFTQREATQGDGGEVAMDAYAQATNRVLPLLFDGLVHRNEFAVAEYVIRSRGDSLGWNGSLLFYYGEVYRQRGNPRDLVTARDIYNRSTQFVDAPPETWRGLGMCELRLGNAAEGKRALTEYLLRKPDAVDAASIRALVEN